MQDQYQYADIGFKMNEGDYVIDAGACIGDTSLFFAHRVGATGKVFAFEMLDENLKVLRRNFALNKELAERIEVIEKPVHEFSEKQFYIFKQGPASRVTDSIQEADSNCSVVASISIDDLIETGDIPKIDLIKMDVEGAELSALKGAEKTIRKFKPKLAICVYHRELDFDEIPRYIDSLNLGYRFYLKHHGIQQGETVLYCR